VSANEITAGTQGDGSSDSTLERLRGFAARQRWWVGRIAVLPIHMLLFAFVVFFLVRSIPGDPVISVTGGQITPAVYASVKHALGLDGSMLQQLGSYFKSVITLDLGNSMLSGRSVISELIVRFPATLELALMGLIAVLIVSLIGAYLVVMYPTSVLSRALRAYARTAGAIPEFCVGIALIFVFYAVLHWAPAPLGRVSPELSEPTRVTGMPFLDSVLTGNWADVRSMAGHLVLPITVEVVAQSAVLLRLLVSGLEEAVDAPPTRFRIASGAPRSLVVLSVYRRALPAMVTMLGTLFGYLLGGAVILESLFGFTGMGQYMVDAVNSKDLVAMQGFLLAVAAISLVVFLAVDLVNMVLDPRRKPGVQIEEA
jgi:ABC-type dipeptide/oligopeptide/nickel transport system permease component